MPASASIKGAISRFLKTDIEQGANAVFCSLGVRTWRDGMIRKVMILITVSLLSCLLWGCDKQGDEAAPKAESDQSSVPEHSEKPSGGTPALQPIEGDVKELEEHENEDDEEERQLKVKEAC